MKFIGMIAVLSGAACMVGCGKRVTCGAGTANQGGRCVPASPILQCGEGTHVVGLRCVPDPSDACGPGTYADGGLCFPIQPDGGFTDATPWRPNVRVSSQDTPQSVEPQLAVDSHGTLYVANMTGQGQYGVQLYRSTDRGSSFQKIVEHAPTPQGSFLGDVTVAVDGSARVFFAWVQYAYGPSGVSSDLYATWSSDGTTFTQPQQVSPNDPSYPFNDRPWLSLAPDGSMILSWTNGTAQSAQGQGGTGAKYAVSQGGQLFGGPMVIEPPTGSILIESPLGFGPSGSPVGVGSGFVSNGGSDYTYALEAWTESGGAWSSSQIAALMYERHFFFEAVPIVRSDAQGKLTALFLNGVSRAVRPYATRSTDSGATWSQPAPVDVDDVESTAALPWVTSDEQGRVHALWLDNRTGAWIPYTAMAADGVHFGQVERIGDHQFVEDGDSLRWIGDFNALVVRGGTRYAVWTDTRDGVSQIYFSSAPAP